MYKVDFNRCIMGNRIITSSEIFYTYEVPSSKVKNSEIVYLVRKGLICLKITSHDDYLEFLKTDWGRKFDSRKNELEERYKENPALKKEHVNCLGLYFYYKKNNLKTEIKNENILLDIQYDSFLSLSDPESEDIKLQLQYDKNILYIKEPNKYIYFTREFCDSVGRDYFYDLVKKNEFYILIDKFIKFNKEKEMSESFIENLSKEIIKKIK